MSNILVAYFSASGVTAKAAKAIAKAADADLFEIVPQQVYTKADLNWMDKKSRSSVEMNDRNCRPAIALTVENFEQYNTIFIGFPVWWYREPSIIDTFIESYDFTGKTVVPFCTSGSSGIGEAPANMQALAKGAKVTGGKRLTGRETEDELKVWMKEING
ncbi:MAG: NAD(P)H-dependent oxidoreductase [Clostridia bacterium]|nr:NAD(P)H-dependent oxidoreductase [Clostridia bacterium]